MAKTIKFNLICDEKPVRTIEDLQNNFSIEDVLDYFNNQLLHRWLRVRGYEKELEAVSSITSKEPMEIIKKLIQIFAVTADEKKIEESVYMLQYLEERKENFAIYEEEKYNTAHIIEDYEAGYHRLVTDILLHPTDAAKIKANIAEITSNYAWAFELDHRALFWKLQEKSVLAVICLLMNEKSRKYYLPARKIEKDGTVTLDTQNNSDQEAMYNKICALILSSEFITSLGENLITFAGVTDGYWKDLEPKGKQFMIIKMGRGDYVRSAGHSGGDLSYQDIVDQFVIVDGIDYKSNNASHKLCYMEV